MAILKNHLSFFRHDFSRIEMYRDKSEISIWKITKFSVPFAQSIENLLKNYTSLIINFRLRNSVAVLRGAPTIRYSGRRKITKSQSRLEKKESNAKPTSSLLVRTLSTGSQPPITVAGASRVSRFAPFLGFGFTNRVHWLTRGGHRRVAWLCEHTR